MQGAGLMVTYVKGDLFQSPARVLVNTVNTVGVMGKGIARTFKDIFPEMFRRYQHHCETKALTVGSLWLYKTDHKWILNFPTKVHWKQPSRPEYVEAGLKKFAATYAQHGISSIAFPQLGCGNGELDWNKTVRPLMERYLGDLPIDIFVYIYHAPFRPEHKATDETKRWLLSEPRSIAFATFWEDMTALIGPGRDMLTAAGHTFRVSLAGGGNDLRIKMRNPAFSDVIEGFANLFTGRRPLSIDKSSATIPSDYMLDLWQAIRTYGFCTARMMPSGLDILAPYLLPLLAQLPYMRPVELSRGKNGAADLAEHGLQLYAPPTEGGTVASPPLAAARRA
jgi:O-acetyl-ADP-ribose deacetylase (regulator of RNase III)